MSSNQEVLLSRRQFFRASGLSLTGLAAPKLAELRTVAKEDLFPPSGEVNAWDGAWSLPETGSDNPLKASDMQLWMGRLEGMLSGGEIREGDIRTFDQMRELGMVSSRWTYDSLTSLKRAGGDFSRGRLAWAHHWDNNEIPRAWESAQVLEWQCSDIIKNIMGEPVNQEDVDLLYSNLKGQLMGMKGYRDSSALYTTNTYTGPSGTRFSQPEREICSVYVKGVNRGEEFITNVNGRDTLVNSISAQFGFVFSIGTDKLELDDDKVAHVMIPGRDGKTYHLYARVFDLWSQPRHSLFGINGVTQASVQSGPGWGSQVLPHCGESAPAQIQQQQVNESGQPNEQTECCSVVETTDKTGEGETGIGDDRSVGGTLGEDQAGSGR